MSNDPLSFASIFFFLCYSLDWCFSNEGFTYLHLKSYGSVSWMVLNEDLHLLSGNKDVFLSEEQKSIIHYVSEEKLPPEKGSLTFIKGGYGSGKTMMGIEVARMKAAQRE